MELSQRLQMLSLQRRQSGLASCSAQLVSKQLHKHLHVFLRPLLLSAHSLFTVVSFFSLSSSSCNFQQLQG
jgi:hypothetical protein